MSKSYKVLVVDDEALIRAYNSSCLKELGHKVVGEATNGDDAVEKAASLKPEVILMDIKMPGVDGISAARIIQEKSLAPVIMLTSIESEELIEKVSESGAIAYLTKPPRPIELHRTICMAVARHRDMLEIKALSESLATTLDEKESIITELRDVLDLISPDEDGQQKCPSCGEPLVNNDSLSTNHENMHERPGSSQAASLDNGVLKFTKRELEVLELIKQGKSTWDTATILGISQNTVKFHVSSILKKTDSVTRAQAVATAMKSIII